MVGRLVITTKAKQTTLNESIVIFTTGLSKLHHFEFPNYACSLHLGEKKKHKSNSVFFIASNDPAQSEVADHCVLCHHTLTLQSLLWIISNPGLSAHVLICPNHLFRSNKNTAFIIVIMQNRHRYTHTFILKEFPNWKEYLLGILK